MKQLPHSRLEKTPQALHTLPMSANTKYKDSVFSLIFSDPDLLRELYCALEGVDLPKDIPVTINTLQDVLFMDRVNDISFEIDGKLIVLLEHQSTVNPNIPLRLLMYIARLYEKTIGGKNVYSRKLIRIARAVFIVLYNGKEEFPDSKILKLSDMLEDASSLKIPVKEPALELTVKVLNINHGRNADIAKKCKTLAGYSAFVAKVREFEDAGVDRTEAVKQAVKYCSDHDILKEFMEKNSSEVFNMLFKEWNLDDAIAVSREEGIEVGIERGWKDGLETTARNALAKGLSLELIRDLTGLDIDTIARLQPGA